MARSRKKRASPASKRADALYTKLKPHIVEMIEREFADVKKQVIADFFHGAERMGDVAAVLKAAILSGDDRWERRWPPPIPVLELAPSTIAA